VMSQLLRRLLTFLQQPLRPQLHRLKHVNSISCGRSSRQEIGTR
jgi:hypothetical protein